MAAKTKCLGGQQQNPHPTPANLLDQVLAGRVVPAVNSVLMAPHGGDPGRFDSI